MRHSIIAWGAIMVLTSAGTAWSGLGVGDVSGTWEGTAKCKYEGQPDFKEKETVTMLVDQDGQFAAAELADQELCGRVEPELDKPDRVALSLSPLTNFSQEPLFGSYPMQILLQAKVDPVSGKMKGRGIVIHPLSKGSIGSCKFKFKRISGETPVLGKFSGGCSFD
ncbi:MAG TPA: hypothetical protein VEL28_16395 [Candidatus Binatia bacterium]|nr:hypothetical protein [Candidatus Binatia bacterium]